MANDKLIGYPSSQEYALKVKIADIVSADEQQIEAWVKQLSYYVNERMREDNSSYVSDAVSRSQVNAWMDCFSFIAQTMFDLTKEKQEFELIFEYSLPGTVHERPDVFLLTEMKAISLEFKRKSAPQVDSNKDDIAQAIRYKEWLENHHNVTRERNVTVISYLVCTNADAQKGSLRGIDILTRDNFRETVDHELEGEQLCSFIDEWLASGKTEMPDMLLAIQSMYKQGKIPYISDVNKDCLKQVLWYIKGAKKKGRKALILINGVPGAGKTAVGQSVVFKENVNGEANAVYLSGNGPLIEVLQYQINQVTNEKHAGENAIQGMKNFKSEYFFSNKIPEQYILIFDEAQRAWNAKKLGKGFSEPEGLLRVGDRIHQTRGCVIIIGLYGNGQAIYKGEEDGIALWRDALLKYQDWYVVASESLAQQLPETGTYNKRHKYVDDKVYLPVSLRADFIDCSKWVEQAVGRNGNQENARKELESLQKTSLRICLTRDAEKVKERMKEIDADHPDWRYGILISNFAEQTVIRKAFPEWNIGYNGRNTVSIGGYGPWYSGESKQLDKACSVYGNQGLELDCPIILFGGEYVRYNNKWITRGDSYKRQKLQFIDPDTIVENNFRVLLTRARKEMILLVPNDPVLDKTYQYFADMGMDIL